MLPKLESGSKINGNILEKCSVNNANVSLTYFHDGHKQQSCSMHSQILMGLSEFEVWLCVGKAGKKLIILIPV